MSILDELEAFAASSGVRCRIEVLALDHPVEHHDLMEALASPAQHSAVARWWDATRGERTGVEISDNIVARHRRKECRRCR